MGEIFWEDFFGGFFWEDYWEIFLGRIIRRIFLGEFFGRDSLFTLELTLDFVKILDFFKILSQWRRKEEGGRRKEDGGRRKDKNFRSLEVRRKYIALKKTENLFKSLKI